jgi:hypothetical protein
MRATTSKKNLPALMGLFVRKEANTGWLQPMVRASEAMSENPLLWAMKMDVLGLGPGGS